LLRRFLDYVEIRTKITSLFAFVMTLAYLFFLKQEINIKLTAVFFLSMFLFDLTTTAINNYIDTKTNHQALQFDRKTALTIIMLMLVISITLGLYLAWSTDIVVLMLGGICFLCGVFYTYGPIPISRQPLGEIFSGIFYGLLIPFKQLVQAEVFDSELDQAKHFLDTGYITAAAVTAGVVLETAIRELCKNHDEIELYPENSTIPKKLDVLNAALKKADVYGVLQQKRITALADIRNSAAHGNTENFNKDDVVDMIRDIERFLLEYLS